MLRKTIIKEHPLNFLQILGSVSHPVRVDVRLDESRRIQCRAFTHAGWEIQVHSCRGEAIKCTVGMILQNNAHAAGFTGAAGAGGAAAAGAVPPIGGAQRVRRRRTARCCRLFDPLSVAHLPFPSRGNLQSKRRRSREHPYAAPLHAQPPVPTRSARAGPAYAGQGQVRFAE
jgi:hypothetical protein